MLLRLFLACVLGLAYLPLYAQHADIDSLQQTLTTPLSDSVRIETLIKLADKLVFEDPPMGMHYAMQADSLCDSSANPVQWARAQLILGDQLATKGEMERATNTKLKGLAALEQSNDLKALTAGYISVGRTAHAFNQWGDALKYSSKAQKVATELENESLLATARGNMASAFEAQQEYDSALHYYDLALAHFLEENDERAIIGTYNNIGVLYESLDEYEKALEYLVKAYELVKEVNDQFGFMLLSTNIGDNLRKLKRWDEALSYYGPAHELANASGIVMLSHNQNFGMAICYNGLGQYQQAYDHMNRYRIFADSLFSEEKMTAIAELEEQYATQQTQQELAMKDQELHLLTQEAELDRLQLGAALGGLALLLIIALLLWNRIRLKRQHESALFAAQQAQQQQHIEGLEHDLESSNKRLTRYALQMAERKGKLNQLTSDVATLNTDRLNQSAKNQVQQVHQQLQQLTESDGDWEEFSLYFEQVHRTFFTNLKSRFSELTNNELRLAALLRLNLNTKEIANLLALSPKSVEVARYRLRKKLNIEQGTALYDFLIQLDE